MEKFWRKKRKSMQKPTVGDPIKEVATKQFFFLSWKQTIGVSVI